MIINDIAFHVLSLHFPGKNIRRFKQRNQLIYCVLRRYAGPILHDISYIYCIIIITIDFSLLEISLLCVVMPEFHYAG